MATKQQTPLNHARQVLDIELAGLKAVRSQLDGQFTATVDILKQALTRRNKLVVVGIGKSGNIGQKISATFNSNSITKFFGNLFLFFGLILIKYIRINSMR